MPSQICFGVPAKIGEKVTLEYDRVAGLKDKWFLKRCVKYLSGSKDIREIDSPDWNTGCQTLELLVTELQVNADIPVSLFQWPKAKAGMTISDADEKRSVHFRGAAGLTDVRLVAGLAGAVFSAAQAVGLG